MSWVAAAPAGGGTETLRTPPKYDSASFADRDQLAPAILLGEYHPMEGGRKPLGRPRREQVCFPSGIGLISFCNNPNPPIHTHAAEGSRQQGDRAGAHPPRCQVERERERERERVRG